VPVSPEWAPWGGAKGEDTGEVGKAPSRPQNQQITEETGDLQGWCRCPRVPQSTWGEHAQPGAGCGVMPAQLSRRVPHSLRARAGDADARQRIHAGVPQRCHLHRAGDGGFWQHRGACGWHRPRLPTRQPRVQPGGGSQPRAAFLHRHAHRWVPGPLPSPRCTLQHPWEPSRSRGPAGEIRVVGTLDSQRQQSYGLTVRLTDTRNDLDPAKRRRRLCDVTVRLQVRPRARRVKHGGCERRGYHAISPRLRQAVLDQAPVCTPEVRELRITAGSGSRQPVTHLACQGSPDGAALAYTIAGGEEQPSHSTTRPLAAAWH